MGVSPETFSFLLLASVGGSYEWMSGKVNTAGWFIQISDFLQAILHHCLFVLLSCSAPTIHGLGGPIRSIVGARAVGMRLGGPLWSPVRYPTCVSLFEMYWPLWSPVRCLENRPALLHERDYYRLQNLRMRDLSCDQRH